MSFLMLIESIARNYTSVTIENQQVIYQQRIIYQNLINTYYFFYKNTKKGFPDKSFFGFLHTWEDICLIVFCSNSYEKSIYQLLFNALFA